MTNQEWQALTDEEKTFIAGFTAGEQLLDRGETEREYFGTDRYGLLLGPRAEVSRFRRAYALAARREFRRTEREPHLPASWLALS